MRHFCKFQLHRFDTVDMTDNQFFSEVVSLDLTWWPHLRGQEVKNFRQHVQWIAQKVLKIWRRSAPPFLSYRKKTVGGGSELPPPPPRRGLTRALEGGGAKNAHPSGFSRIAEKRRRAAPPFFQYLLKIEFDTLCKNFSPRSPKVRSPGQVKVKNGFLTLRLRSGHTRYPIGFKPSAFHKVIDIYNLYISDFWYLSP